MDTTQQSGPAACMTIQTRFVRGRNALVAAADFEPLFVDYFLHLADQGMELAAGHEELIKDALAGVALHAAVRPLDEIIAWTIHLQRPLVNLFVTADNENGAVTGRLFDEDIKDAGKNLFYADVVRKRSAKRRSVVEFFGPDILNAIEHFYQQSEQRPARLLRLDGERRAIIAAQPDADIQWLQGLVAADIDSLENAEQLTPMEVRPCMWFCGCNQKRICDVLAPQFGKDLDGLFTGEDAVTVQCPRCGAHHRITREGMEAHLAEK